MGKDGKKKGRDTPKHMNKVGPSQEKREAQLAQHVGTVRIGAKTSAIVLDLLRLLEQEKEQRLADDAATQAAAPSEPEPEPDPVPRPDSELERQTLHTIADLEAQPESQPVGATAGVVAPMSETALAAGFGRGRGRGRGTPRTFGGQGPVRLPQFQQPQLTDIARTVAPISEAASEAGFGRGGGCGRSTAQHAAEGSGFDRGRGRGRGEHVPEAWARHAATAGTGAAVSSANTACGSGNARDPDDMPPQGLSQKEKQEWLKRRIRKQEKDKARAARRADATSENVSSPAPEPAPAGNEKQGLDFAYRSSKYGGFDSSSSWTPATSLGKAKAAQEALIGDAQDDIGDKTAAQAKASQRRRATELKGKANLAAKERERWVDEMSKKVMEKEAEASANEKLLKRLEKDSKRAEKEAERARLREEAKASHFLPHGTKPQATSVRLQISIDTAPEDAKTVVLPRKAQLDDVYKTAKNKFKKMKRPVRAFLLTDDDLDIPILGTHNLIDGARVCVSATAAVSPNAGIDTSDAEDSRGQKATSKRDLEEMRKAEISRVQAAIAKERADANREEVEKFSDAQANVRRVREAYNRRTRPRAVDSVAAAEHEARENTWLADRATAIAAARESELAAIVAARERLPAFQHRAEILEAVFGQTSGQVCVISGETGCGKTTQVPQFILEDAIQRGIGGGCNIVCTQPRRISAIGVAERVASERGEQVGQSTGYAIKGESRSSAHTRLLFCTVGVLLRRLQSEPALGSVSHLVVDEVHERDVLTDFLLVLVRDILAVRRELKLILMSATLSASKFAQYFARPGQPAVPTLAIPGFSYPVQDYFLEDVIEATRWRPPVGGGSGRASFSSNAPTVGPTCTSAGGSFDGGSGGRLKVTEGYSQATAQALSATEQDVIDYELIQTTLELICGTGGSRQRQSVKVGGILVFLPGMMEIRKLCDMLSESKAFSDSRRYIILGLHSSLDSQAQRAIFRRCPPGVIKIVVSTNIAETSITIDEITHVVDCGRVKEMQYNPEKRMSHLCETWCSQASVKQRRGRAGRTREGVCYKLFSRQVHEDVMAPYQLPEIKRVPLEDLTLQILLGASQPATFLMKALDPPAPEAVRAAICNLHQLGAIATATATTGNCAGSLQCELTPLGFHLAHIPVEPRVGKMLIFGCIFGVLPPMLTIAAAWAGKSPFNAPLGKQAEADRSKRDFCEGTHSDHLAVVAAYDGWIGARSGQLKPRGGGRSRGADGRGRKGGRGGGRSAEAEYCWSRFLNISTLREMDGTRRQLFSQLQTAGFVSRRARLDQALTSTGTEGRGGQEEQHLYSFARNVGNASLVKCVLTAALYPSVARVGAPAGNSKRPVLLTRTESVNARTDSRELKGYMVFLEKVKTSAVFLRDSTAISHYPLLLFGGSHLRIDHTKGMQKISIVESDGVLFKLLREELDRLLLAQIEAPGDEGDLSAGAVGSTAVSAVLQLLEDEERQMVY